MSHQDLLQKINTIKNEGERLESPLRAVIELHRPKTNSPDDPRLFCDGGHNIITAYPCATIQAIEKELR